MRIIIIAIITIGLGLAFFAVKFVQNYIGQYEAALSDANRRAALAIPLVEVYVASTNIALGDKITNENVRAAKWPRESVAEGIFIVGEHEITGAEGEERSALRAMVANEPFMNSNVSQPGHGAGLLSHLGDNESAYTIEVSLQNGASNLMRPGDYIDIYWTGRLPQSGPGDITSNQIEQSMRLLAINDQEIYDPQTHGPPNAITVLASTEQVQFLSKALSFGKLSIVQAPPSAGNALPLSIDRTKFFNPISAVATEEEKTICQVVVNKGGTVSTTNVPCADLPQTP